jgi:hypothetical protein
MLPKPLKGSIYTPGSAAVTDKERLLFKIKFKVHKFNNRPKPTTANRTAIFSCFSEFGSEIVGCLYCIPKLLSERYLGYYSIAMGWHGRAFLYKHLVDEFWEIDEDCQYLRDYCRAFHHESRNLQRLEKKVQAHGLLVHANALSKVALKDVFPKISEVKPYAAFPKLKNPEKLGQLSEYLQKSNLVGITARNRRCYGRNLDVDFYLRLIAMLESMGYNPVWMGEKATSHVCPCPHILDFMGSEHANDLEKTLLLVSKMDFTIQYYTASSRLAALAGTPYIIVESPDQIYGNGQEGMRLNLCSKGDKKMVLAHYKNISENHDHGLALTERAILDIQLGDYTTIIEDGETEMVVRAMQVHGSKRIGEV